MYQEPDGQWYNDNEQTAQAPDQGISPPQPQSGAPVFTSPAGGTIGGGTSSTPNYPGQQPLAGVTGPGGTPLYPSGQQAPQGGGGISFGGPVAPFDPSQVGGSTYPTFQPPPLPDSLQRQFQLPTANDLIQNDPGFQARYQQGLDASQRSAAAQGTLLNGGTQKALTRYGQDYASGEYGNYVNQKLQERGQQANDYLSLAYGPAWQQNQSAVNQYGQLYKQYQDLIGNNRNAQNDYINALLQQENLGLGATRAGAPTPVGVPSGNV